MNNIEHRIEKLEKHTGVDIQEDVSLVVVTGGLDKKQVDAKVEKAIAEYLAAHPECSEQGISVICVPSEQGKRDIERVMNGEGT